MFHRPLLAKPHYTIDTETSTSILTVPVTCGSMFPFLHSCGSQQDCAIIGKHTSMLARTSENRERALSCWGATFISVPVCPRRQFIERRRVPNDVPCTVMRCVRQGKHQLRTARVLHGCRSLGGLDRNGHVSPQVSRRLVEHDKIGLRRVLWKCPGL